MTLSLNKIRRSSGGTVDRLFTEAKALEKSLNFVWGHQYDDVDPSTIDLKAPQNMMLHPEAIILGQEKLRVKCLVDLLQAVDKLQVDSSEERFNLNRPGYSSISFQLGSLDYDNALILFKELSVSSDNEKLFSAK